MSAALYIRLSREDENEGPSQSVENQLAMLTAYCREHALPVFDSYIDDGWSGTNFDRPAFRRMLADIEAGRVDLVVTRTSRVSAAITSAQVTTSSAGFRSTASATFLCSTASTPLRTQVPTSSRPFAPS